MGNLGNFDANNVEPQGSFEPIPAGWYEAMIVDSEFKANSKGTGEYLQLTLDVISGANEGRKLWARLNLNNPNQTAVEIAQRELSAICHAVGILTPDDSSELHDKPLRVKVSVKPAGERNGQHYEASNEIKAYGAIAENGGVNAPKPAAAGTPAAPAGNKKPWEK